MSVDSCRNNGPESECFALFRHRWQRIPATDNGGHLGNASAVRRVGDSSFPISLSRLRHHHQKSRMKRKIKKKIRRIKKRMRNKRKNRKKSLCLIVNQHLIYTSLLLNVMAQVLQQLQPLQHTRLKSRRETEANRNIRRIGSAMIFHAYIAISVSISLSNLVAPDCFCSSLGRLFMPPSTDYTLMPYKEKATTVGCDARNNVSTIKLGCIHSGSHDKDACACCR